MAVQAAELGERVMSVRGGGAWPCPLLTSPTLRSSHLSSHFAQASEEESQMALL